MLRIEGSNKEVTPMLSLLKDCFLMQVGGEERK